MIVPSILSTNFATLPNVFENLEEVGIEMVHFDVMDNHFVPNLTFGYKFIKDLRALTSLKFDVHLMIENPFENLPNYINAGCNIITTHIEAYKNKEEIHKAIQLCHEHEGLFFGLSIKPNTPVNTLLPFIEEIDLVLIMSVEPGFGGQSFIPSSIDKIRELLELKKERNLSFSIEVDGGVNRENMNMLSALGVDYLVMGNAFFKENDFRDLLFSFRKTTH